VVGDGSGLGDGSALGVGSSLAGGSAAYVAAGPTAANRRRKTCRTTSAVRAIRERRDVPSVIIR
jgi:hypothetical protein